MASKKPKDTLFPSDFWDRPDPSMTGDSKPDDTFAAVGRALTAWETVEEELAELCVIFSGLKDGVDENKAMRRFFGAIDSGGSRRKALREAGEVYFWHHDANKTMINKLTDLLDNNVSKGSRLRDDIAHGIVCGFTTAKKHVGTFLIPSFYKSDRNKAFVPFVSEICIDDTEFPFDTINANYRYNSSDIGDITRKFMLLYDEVLKFISEVRNLEKGETSALKPPVD
jgi:hypothetical protein